MPCSSWAMPFYSTAWWTENDTIKIALHLIFYLKRPEGGPKGRPSEASWKLFLSCWLFFSQESVKRLESKHVTWLLEKGVSQWQRERNWRWPIAEPERRGCLETIQRERVGTVNEEGRVRGEKSTRIERSYVYFEYFPIFSSFTTFLQYVL